MPSPERRAISPRQLFALDAEAIDLVVLYGAGEERSEARAPNHGAVRARSTDGRTGDEITLDETEQITI